MMIPTFFGITVLTFGVAHLAPGDPLMIESDAPGGAALGGEAVEAFRERHGLDLPLHQQYFRWLSKVVRLDFGHSLQDHRKVSEKIGESLPRTLLVAGLALFLAYAIAVPLGVYSAIRQRRLSERVLTVALFVLYSMPSFWVAVMLLLTFSSERVLDWFPMQGLTSPDYAALSPGAKVLDVAAHLILPVTCLTYPALATISRYMRSGMLEVVRQDYIRTAFAKGLSERAVVFRHALRNSILPVLTLLGLMLPHLIGGSVIVERIFGIPGMGLLAFDAIGTRDYPTVMGVATVMALVTMLSMLLVDLAYGFIDPRIRLERSS